MEAGRSAGGARQSSATEFDEEPFGCPGVRSRWCSTWVELRQRQCGWCKAEFWICRSCDRGHRYCSKWCSGEARAESVRRARLKHRYSEEGKGDHRDRERLRRARLDESPACVGDQSSNHVEDLANLAAMKTEPTFSDPISRRIPHQCMVCSRSVEGPC